MLMYPEEPLSPLPPPGADGKITLEPVANYWLDAEYSPRDPVYQYKGNAAPSSAAYRYNGRVFQAFNTSAGLGFRVATWWAAGTLNVPATWEEAVGRAWNIYDIWPAAHDSYGTGYLTPIGWKDVLFGDYPKLKFISALSAPLSYHCYHYPEQAVDTDFILKDGFRYYARVGTDQAKYHSVSWFYLPAPSNPSPSLLPWLVPFLLLPVLPFPFLLPLAPFFALGPVGGAYGAYGAYGAGGSVNTSAGRRRKEKS